MKTLATDLDGTIYIEDRLIKDVKESHNKLIKENFRIIYTTNNSSVHPIKIANKLENLLNTEIEPETIVTPLKVLSKFIKNKNIKFYIHGTEELINFVSEIATVTTSIHDSEMILIGRKEIINTKEINEIIKFVKNGKKIMGMNKDLSFPSYDNKEKIGNGAVIKLIEDELNINIKSFGKPESLYSEYIKKKYKDIDFMIGDRVDTDILLGNNIDATTFLVTSSIKNYMEDSIADYNFNNFSECVSFILKNSK